jgi:hypothetical protein
MTIQPTLERRLPGGNEQRLFRFDNNLGASVVRGRFTYGGDQGLFEMAVLRFTGPNAVDFKLDYDTGITDDVIGWLGEDEVQEILARIRELPNPNVVKVESQLGDQPAIEGAEAGR